MPRPSTAIRVQGRGGCDVFFAVRSYIQGEVQLCDIINLDLNMYFIGCTVINGQVNKIGAPEGPWDGTLDGSYPQVVAMYRSLGRSPLVLGRLDNSTVKFSADIPQSRHDDSDEDVDTDFVDLQDVAVCNDGSKFIIKSSTTGDIIFSPIRSMKFQLPDDGVFKISRAGNANDGPVLAGPYVERDDAFRIFAAAVEEFLKNIVVGNTGELRMSDPTKAVFLASAPEEVSTGDVKSSVLLLPSDTDD